MNNRILSYLLVLLFVLFSPSYLFQIDNNKKEYDKKEIYIPADLDDCFKELNKIIPFEEIEVLKNSTEKNLIMLHFSLGLWLRNNWGLWKNSRLAKYFKKLDIKHPDDMSMFIIISYHRYLNKKENSLESHLKYYNALISEYNKANTKKIDIEKDFEFDKYTTNSDEQLRAYLEYLEVISEKDKQKIHEISKINDNKNRLTDKGLEVLSNLRSLKILRIYDAKNITDKGLMSISHISSLEELSISAGSITDDGLKVLKDLHNLKSLRLANCRIKEKGLTYIGNICSLTDLDIDNIKVSSEGFKAICQLKIIEKLNITDADIIDTDLFFLKELTSLNSLSLSDTNIRGKGFLYLKDLKKLKVLEIFSEVLTDEGIKDISQLKTIERLCISSPILTDSSFSVFKDLPNLESLALFNVKISDSSLLILSEIITLRYLIIHKIPITNNGIQYLKKLKRLEYIHLSATNVNISCDELKKVLPNIKNCLITK